MRRSMPNLERISFIANADRMLVQSESLLAQGVEDNGVEGEHEEVGGDVDHDESEGLAN